MESFAYFIALCFFINLFWFSLNGIVWTFSRLLQKNSNKVAIFMVHEYGMEEAGRLVREWKSKHTLTLKTKEKLKMLNSIATYLYGFFMSYAVVLGYFFMVVFSMIATFMCFIINYEFSKTVFNKVRNALENHRLYKEIRIELQNQNEWHKEKSK